MEESSWNQSSSLQVALRQLIHAGQSSWVFQSLSAFAAVTDVRPEYQRKFHVHQRKRHEVSHVHFACPYFPLLGLVLSTKLLHTHVVIEHIQPVQPQCSAWTLLDNKANTLTTDLDFPPLPSSRSKLLKSKSLCASIPQTPLT